MMNQRFEEKFINHMNDALVISLESEEKQEVFEKHFEAMLETVDGHYHSKNKAAKTLAEKRTPEVFKDMERFNAPLIFDSYMISSIEEMRQLEKEN